MTFGEKLRQLRKRKKLTQEQLAELIGTHESHIGRYERDESNSSANVLIKISEVFDVSIDSLLLDEKKFQPFPQITDKELLEQLEEIDKMDEDKRALAKRILSMLINEDKIKKLLP